MTDMEKKTTLLFVKNADHQFAPVERFLSKRGYKVITETDVKKALECISKLDPEYIFLAWDHKDKKVRYLPKSIYQCGTGHIVPFIMSTGRDQLIQLEASGFENKLYPPLSGPAIERVISKHEKQNLIFDKISKKDFESTKAEMMNLNDISIISAKSNPENISISFKQTRDIQQIFISDDVKKGSELFIKEDKTSSMYVSKEEKHLTEHLMSLLDHSFQQTIKPEMLDVIETYSDINATSNDINSTTQVYVMVIQEYQWTGYLTVASESYLDLASTQVILNNWIESMTTNEKIAIQLKNEPQDMVLYELQVPKVDFPNLCHTKADFFNDLIHEGKKTMLGFFSFSPYRVVNSVHAKFDLLELPTEFLQPQEPLPFDVNIYLPENKRFILYLRPGSFLENAQVHRLQTRKVDHIYSAVQYERDLLKYKAEFNLRALIKSYNESKGQAV